MKKFAIIVASAALFLATAIPSFAKVATIPGPWNVSGSYNINVNYLSIDYPETLILTQSGTSITGGSLNTVPPAAGSAFTVIDGSVTGNAIDLHAKQDVSSLVVHMWGTIAPDGSMSGDWADVFPGTRTGTWVSTSGNAYRFEGNHGQYVSSQENKQEAAQSRVGMPVQSKGHTK